jgi:hypothetical protein
MIFRCLTLILSCIVPLCCVCLTFCTVAQAQSVANRKWSAEVLPVELGVGYAVRAVDLSRDGKLDIAIVDSKRIVWLENPTWKVHTIYQTPSNYADNVCFAPLDIDRDGDIDFAIGTDWQPNNTQSGGAVGWIESPQDPRSTWIYHPILEPEPTVHRMHWVDWDADGKPELIVAPLKGPKSTAPKFEDVPVRLSAFVPGKDPRKDPWVNHPIEVPLFVMHNFDRVKRPELGEDLVTASFQGVHLLSNDTKNSKVSIARIGSGLEADAPGKGSSEVRLGKLSAKQRFAATIEPWHGNQVVVYEEPVAQQSGQSMWPRKVIDDQLKWGHAVVTLNLDDDPEEELAIGVRDDVSPHRCGVRVYDRQKDGIWARTLIEPGQVAVEDMVSADLDGDGRPELIAVGRATHNAVIYRQD